MLTESGEVREMGMMKKLPGKIYKRQNWYINIYAMLTK